MKMRILVRSQNRKHINEGRAHSTRCNTWTSLLRQMIPQMSLSPLCLFRPFPFFPRADVSREPLNRWCGKNEKTMHHYYRRIQDATAIDQDSRRKKVLGSRTLREGEKKERKLKMMRWWGEKSKDELWHETSSHLLFSPSRSQCNSSFWLLVFTSFFWFDLLSHFTIATGSCLLLVYLCCPPVCSPFVFFKTDCPSLLSCHRHTRRPFSSRGDFCFWRSSNGHSPLYLYWRLICGNYLMGRWYWSTFLCSFFPFSPSRTNYSHTHSALYNNPDYQYRRLVWEKNIFPFFVLAAFLHWNSAARRKKTLRYHKRDARL